LNSIAVSWVLVTLARIPKVRRICFLLALKLERGQFYSATARRILSKYYGVEIGAFSYGSCFRPGLFPPGVTIGRYVSCAGEITILLRNHPLDRLSTHPFFFNHKLGYIEKDSMEFGRLVVEHDAWIGEKVIITRGCSRIGLGAVVAAGAVVTRDVPDFAVVGGSPARVIKYRFPEATRHRIRSSKWWELPLSVVIKEAGAMQQSLDDAGATHPLLERSV
jgi:acetyltransferase-like isoleucine patch superfamily enzyme